MNNTSFTICINRSSHQVSLYLCCLFQQDGYRTDSQRLANAEFTILTLLEKEKEKKKKKRVGVATLGRRFDGQTRRVLDFPSTSEEAGKGDAVPSESEAEEEEDEDYSEQQYPPADEKYKNLEERLAAMEVQRVHGLDFEELGLVSRIVIPPKFKVPLFAKYDRVSCPKMHLRSYVRKIQPYSSDKDL